MLHYPFLVLTNFWKPGDHLIVVGYGFLGEGCSVQSAAMLPTLIYIPQAAHCIWESCLLSSTEPLQWADSFRDFSVITYKSLPWSVFCCTFPLNRHFQFLLLLYCWIWTQYFTVMICYRSFDITVTERWGIHCLPLFPVQPLSQSTSNEWGGGNLPKKINLSLKMITGFEGREIFLLTEQAHLMFKIC